MLNVGESRCRRKGARHQFGIVRIQARGLFKEWLCILSRAQNEVDLASAPHELGALGVHRKGGEAKLNQFDEVKR